jgi:hypothetical protein
MGALIVHDDVLELIGEKLEKYELLVWYARKDKDPNSKYWEDVKPDLKEGALQAIKDTERDFPGETLLLNDPLTGAWEHGFNSGVLAALRYVLHAAGDPEEAEACFPELDT